MRIGFAQIDITPGPQNGLVGYDFRQKELPPGNAGVHDPLFARVVVFDDGDGKAALISLDLCILTVDLARRLRQAVAEKLGIGWERVIIACTHTHSGPFPRLPAGNVHLASGDPAADFAYAAFLEAQLLTAAAEAGGLTFPCTMAWQEAPAGLGYRRRVMTPTGIRHCWNPAEQPYLHPEPAPDPTCTLLDFRALSSRRRFLLWSLGLHGVTLGKTSRVVSADWPGATCGLLDAEAPGTHSLFVPGAAGDAHPWIATQEDPAMILPVARAAAATVSLLAQSSSPRDEDADPKLHIAARTVTFGDHELDLSLWRLGSAWIAAAPVELFGELGLRLRRQLPGPVLLATVANGWTGYWPTAEAFDEGGYEINASWVCRKGDGERLMDELAAMQKGL